MVVFIIVFVLGSTCMITYEIAGFFGIAAALFGYSCTPVIMIGISMFSTFADNAYLMAKLGHVF